MSYILASASPRRSELLKIITPDFKIIPSSVEEIVPTKVPVIMHPEYLARLKATDVSKQFETETVIGADTSVIIDGTILGKPKSASDAEKMLKMLSGQTHQVITGCAVIKNGIYRSFSVSTDVEFYTLTNDEIKDYIATNEPFDKAGSYGIQGYGSLLVKRINGDYFNVVGLPIAELKRVLESI